MAADSRSSGEETAGCLIVHDDGVCGSAYVETAVARCGRSAYNLLHVASLHDNGTVVLDLSAQMLLARDLFEPIPVVLEASQVVIRAYRGPLDHFHGRM